MKSVQYFIFQTGYFKMTQEFGRSERIVNSFTSDTEIYMEPDTLGILQLSTQIMQNVMCYGIINEISQIK